MPDDGRPLPIRRGQSSSRTLLARRVSPAKALLCVFGPDAVDNAFRSQGVWLPTIGASVIALLGGWMIDAMLQPLFGTGPTLVVSLLGSSVLFYMARKWLKDLRDG